MQPVTSPSKPHPAAAYHERRRREVDGKILATARVVLGREGLDAFTVEQVARESGVAKTTIYRRYENATTLAQAAVLTDASSDALDVVALTMRSAADAVIDSAITAGDLHADVDRSVVLALALAREAA